MVSCSSDSIGRFSERFVVDDEDVEDKVEDGNEEETRAGLELVDEDVEEDTSVGWTFFLTWRVLTTGAEEGEFELEFEDEVEVEVVVVVVVVVAKLEDEEEEVEELPNPKVVSAFNCFLAFSYCSLATASISSLSSAIYKRK